MEARSTIDPSTPRGYVYLVVNHTRTAAKIGYTTNTYARFAQMQTANPEPLSMEYEIPASRDVERKLHKHFNSKRVRLEWFANVDELDAFFEDLRTDYEDKDLNHIVFGGPDPTLTAADIDALVARLRE